MGARVRYFDGETWWYEQCQVAEELGVATSTIAKWRRVKIGDESLVRSLRQGAKLLVALVDVFYVVENRERLFEAGVRLTPEEERKRKAEYVRTLQGISLDFAIHRGEEYSTDEVREIANREGSVFEAAVEHGRTYYGGQYAARLGRRNDS